MASAEGKVPAQYHIVDHCCQTQRRLRQSGFDSLSVCGLYSHAPEKAAEPNWFAHAWLRSTEVQVRQPNGAIRILHASHAGRSCRTAECRKGVGDELMLNVLRCHETY